MPRLTIDVEPEGHGATMHVEDGPLTAAQASAALVAIMDRAVDAADFDPLQFQGQLLAGITQAAGRPS